MPEQLEIPINPEQHVTGIFYPASPSGRAHITIVLGHGAGAGQTSGFMVRFAEELALRGLDAVTFNFLYTENGRRVPDPGPRLEECYRAVIAVVKGRTRLATNKLFIGGK